MPTITPESGDIYQIQDRKQLGFSQNGTNFSLQPNQWYTSGQSITKGFAVSVANSSAASGIGGGAVAGNLFNTQVGLTTATVGIALNTVSGQGNAVEVTDHGVYTWPYYFLPTVTGSVSGGFTITPSDGEQAITYSGISGTNPATLIANMLTAYNTTGPQIPKVQLGSLNVSVTLTGTIASNVITIVTGSYQSVFAGMLATGTGITAGAYVSSVTPTTITLVGTVSNSGSPISITFSSTVLTLTYSGQASTWPVLTNTLTNATLTLQTVFQTSDLGNVVYISPVVNPTLPNQQFTTDANFASSTAFSPIEVGIATSISTNGSSSTYTPSAMFVDFNGVARGSSGLSTISAISGETLLIPNGGTQPILVSLGLDGKAYNADNRKSQQVNTYSLITTSTTATSITATLSVTANATNIMVGSTVSGNSNIPSGVTVSNVNTGTGVLTLTLGGASFTTIAGTANTNFTGIPNRNYPTGFVIGGTGFSSGTIVAGTNIVIQKAGNLSGFSGLTIGQQVYLGNSGNQTPNGDLTQSTSGMSPYSTITTPVGTASNATTIYVEIGFNSQYSDTADVGTMIAVSSTGTADSGYLLANGATMNALTTTVNPTNQVAGTYDGTALYTKIGTSFGGSYVYTATESAIPTAGGVVINGQTLTPTYNSTLATQLSNIVTAINGATILGTTASSNATTLTIAIDATVALVTNPTITFTLNNMTFTLNNTSTYKLPSYNTLNPKIQIKYNNWYTFNSPTPLYRVDTDWNTVGTVPVIATASSGNMTSGGYFEIPLTAFGQAPSLADIFVTLTVKDGSGNLRQISEGFISYGGSQYGFQASTHNAGTVRLEFAPAGLAYFDSGSVPTVVPGSWTYRVLVYKTERFNKYYDYTLDQWFSQFKSLNLVNYTASTNTPGAGYFDLSSTNPITGTRLNFSGSFWGYSLNSTTSITSVGNAYIFGTGTNIGTLSTASLTAPRTYTLSDNSGVLLLSASAQTIGYFDNTITAPTATTRLNYNGNLYATNLIVSTNITATSGDIIASSGKVIASTGVQAQGTTIDGAYAGFFTSGSATTGRPTSLITGVTLYKSTYSGKFVATSIEANSLIGEVSNAINANGNFDLQPYVASTIPYNWFTYTAGSSGVPVYSTPPWSTGSANITFYVDNAPVSGSLGGALSIGSYGPSLVGQGFYTPFTTPAVRSSTWVRLSFDYSTVNAYVAGNIQVFIVPINGSNHTAITPLVSSIPVNNSGGSFTTYFQPIAGATSYYLCFHIATQPTSNYVLKVSKVSVGIPDTTLSVGTHINGSVTIGSGSAYMLDMAHGVTASYSPIAGNMYFQMSSGGSSYFGGNIIASSVTDTSSGGTGSISTLGGIGITKSLWVGTAITGGGLLTLSSTSSSHLIQSTINSSNPTTGSLILSGGLGVSLNIYSGGIGSFATSLTTAGILTAGVTSSSLTHIIRGNTPSTSYSTGTLTITGTNAGLGVQGSIFAGGTINAQGNITSGGSIIASGAVSGVTTFNSSNIMTLTSAINAGSGGTGALVLSYGGAFIKGDIQLYGTLYGANSNTLTIGSSTVISNSLTVSSGGATITGNVTINGSINVTGSTIIAGYEITASNILVIPTSGPGSTINGAIWIS